MIPGYNSVNSNFFDGETGVEITEAGKDVRIVATYLLIGKEACANQLGMFNVLVSTIAESTGLSMEEVTAALKKLIELGFVKYDFRFKFAFVPRMADHQYPFDVGPTNNIHKHILSKVRLMRGKPFFDEFYKRYRNKFSLPDLATLDDPVHEHTKPKRAAGLLSNAKPYVAPVLPAAVKADMIMALQEVAGVPEPEFPGDASKQAPEPEPEVAPEPEPVVAPAEPEEEIPDPADPYLETLDAEGNVILTAHLLAHGFNQLAAIPFGLPQARIPVSSDRVRHAKVRLEENPDPKWWGIVFVRIGSSSFLCGKNPRRWRADFDWIIRPGNADRVLEGKYDDNQSEDAGAQAR